MVAPRPMLDWAKSAAEKRHQLAARNNE